MSFFDLDATDGTVIFHTIFFLSLHSLCRNDLGDEGAAAMGEALKHNHALTWLVRVVLPCFYYD
jgi:hypothetical protein